MAPAPSRAAYVACGRLTAAPQRKVAWVAGVAPVRCAGWDQLIGESTEGNSPHRVCEGLRSPPRHNLDGFTSGDGEPHRTARGHHDQRCISRRMGTRYIVAVDLGDDVTDP